MTLAITPLRALTQDGVSLAVYRYRDTALPTRGPVILQHGLGSNGAAFTVPSRSLAEHLASHGYDCFVTELRGAGDSEHPRRAFGLDAYLEHDVPTLIARVLETSGAEKLSWIGHSMGGILGLAYCIEHVDTPIARMITVGTSLDYRVGKNVYQDLAVLRPYAHLIPTIPFRALSRVVSRFAGKGPLLPPEKVNFYRPNVDPYIARRVLSQGFEPIPTRLLADLGTTFDPRGFSRKNGTITYLEHVERYDVPTLVIGGSRDAQCPPEATANTCALLSNCTEKHHLAFGRAYGHAEDYGHFDLLVGKRAPQEVWPAIVAFLAGETLQSSDSHAPLHSHATPTPHTQVA